MGGVAWFVALLGWLAMVRLAPSRPTGSARAATFLVYCHLGASGSVSRAGVLAWPGAAFATSLVMVSAMMTVALIPTYRSIARTSRPHMRLTNGACFHVGYLAAWAPFCVATVGVARVLGALRVERTAVFVAALVVAAGWQLSPAKRTARRLCHRAVYLPTRRGLAERRAFAEGVTYGSRCARSCWALMALPMFAVGPTLPWVLGVTVIVIAEKTVVGPPRVGPRRRVLAKRLPSSLHLTRAG